MTITVRFFASLREELGCEKTQVPAQPGTTVSDVWNLATLHHPIPANLLCAINQEYADFSRSVSAGDEVAFFPPVTGG